MLKTDCNYRIYFKIISLAFFLNICISADAVKIPWIDSTPARSTVSMNMSIVPMSMIVSKY